MKKGQHMTEAMKANLRKQKLGKKLSPEHRAKVIKTLRYGFSGEENPGWKGGRSISDEHYVLLRLPDHPNARSNGYFPEHRLVMELHLGRLLSRDEIVHHKNGNRQDNRLENLELTNQHDHAMHHWSDPKTLAEQSERIAEIRKKKFWSSRPKKK